MIRVILGFILAYLFLFALALGIASLWIWLGLVLFKSQLGAMPVLGIVFIPSGLMLVFFLIKFLFVRTPRESEGLELNEVDQPELFEFIRNVASEINTHPPNRVFLTTNVNAYVSQKQNFLSVLFPIGRELTLGLGLINVINVSEFKSLLAHELGHFSQKQMRFKFWVYNFNKAVYNMLYENRGYTRLIESFSHLHWLLSFPVILNALLIKRFQSVLRYFYPFFYKAYLALSRQTELQVDAIAAYNNGSANAISLLGKIPIGDKAYQKAKTLTNTLSLEGKCIGNFYELHLMVLRRYSKSDDIFLDSKGFPVITAEYYAGSQDQVRFENPWAAHPTHFDRFKSLQDLNIGPCDVFSEPAWVIFRNNLEMQELFTKSIYESINHGQNRELASIDEIEEVLLKGFTVNMFDKAYSGYYNNRFISHFNISDAVNSSDIKSDLTFAKLFTNESAKLLKKIDGLESDINKLKIIIGDDGLNIKSFNYQTKAYDFTNAKSIWKKLVAELIVKRDELMNLDQKAFKFFFNLANQAQKLQLLNYYETLFVFQVDSEQDYQYYNELKTNMLEIQSKRANYNQIYQAMNEIYSQEREVKQRIKSLIQDEVLKPLITDTYKEKLDAYVSNNLVYFLEPDFNFDALNTFHEAMDIYCLLINERNFNFEKQLLDFQLSLI